MVKKLSKEHREKISAGLKGHTTPEKTRRKIGASNKITAKRFWEKLTKEEKVERVKKPGFFKKGQKISEKTRKKMLGRKPWNKGKPMTEQTRRKLINTMGTPEFRASLSERRQYIKVPHQDTKPEKIIQAFCNSKGIKFQKHKTN